MRAQVYVLSLTVTSLLLLAHPAGAVEVAPIHISAKALSAGATLALADGAKLGLFPNALPSEADLTWTVSEEALPALPSGWQLLGSPYRLTITGVTTVNTSGTRGLVVSLPLSSSTWTRQLWMYDRTRQQWSQLNGSTNAAKTTIGTETTSLNELFAVLEDHRIEQGLASWYCRSHCSAQYPALHGTSNTFPVGRYVKVTSTETSKSVVVKIVSTWGQPAGRVIDLSWAAYHALGVKNAGVTTVTVVASTPNPAAPAPAVSDAVSSESLPKLQVQAGDTKPVPAVSAKSYVVYDQTTGTVLSSQQADTTLPIASISKLVTAMVALDTNPDLHQVVTYTKADVTSYAYLRVRPGETLTIKDLFYAMLVGSANNGATALARSTGLSRGEFIRQMNTKVAGWGLTHTSFRDVSGLDASNVSSAGDLAIIASHAFHDYPMIRQATTMAAYTFHTVNTKQSHTIKNTDKLILHGAPGLTITGGKTGYLDEALYTYVLRTKNSQGAQVVTVVLADPSSTSRFQDAVNLSSWAWASYRWST
ncbi:MAG: serine hydrolase [Candidatus Kerfeldbacteria bacterium]|nr:serine hydrolase [Candidatus Kerfeldbacteria bacterium]